MVKKFAIGLVILVLVFPLLGQKKGDPWLLIKNDKFAKVTTIVGNDILARKGKKAEGLKGVDPYKRPIFSFSINCPNGDCSSPTAEIHFISLSAEWKYLTCHTTKCLIDNKILELPESEHFGKTYSGFVGEVVIISFPTISEIEKLWNAKIVEFQICNTEFQLSPIEMRMLQELKAYLKQK